MFGSLRKFLSGRNDATAAPSATFEEPTALVVARRERSIGDSGWFKAKSWFGGDPKLGNMPWPRDAKGKPLYFMAQLDLSEIAAAQRGRPALPGEGALAFFVGGEKLGAIVHVRQPGLQATPSPADLCKAEDIGGDPMVDRAHKYGPSGFPYWPVEFRALTLPTRITDTDEEAMDRARQEQAAAIAQLYPLREYNLSAAAIAQRYPLREFNLSAAHAAKSADLGEVPLYWLAARMFAESVPRMRDNVEAARASGAGYIRSSTARLKALEAGLPPPPGQGPFGDPAKERANSENWLAIGRNAIAKADAQSAAVDAYVAKVQVADMGTDPWAEISPKDAERLDDLFNEACSKELVAYARYSLPHSWRDNATDAIKLMAAGPEEAYARLPEGWRDLINTQYRMPIENAHLMFGIGVDIQGNEMFEHPDMRMVLQLTFDDMMYWSLGDNGAYQFWLDKDALRRGDVSAAKVTFEAH